MIATRRQSKPHAALTVEPMPSLWNKHDYWLLSGLAVVVTIELVAVCTGAWECLAMAGVCVAATAFAIRAAHRARRMSIESHRALQRRVAREIGFQRWPR